MMENENALKSTWLKVLGKAVYKVTRLIVGLIILIGVLALVGGVAYLPWDKDPAGGVRNAILLIGVIGGAYGLFIAYKRQKTFSEQVETQIKQADTAQGQLFNERLGRGVELLANENVTIRRTGIKVLADLKKTVTDDQKTLIAEIIHDFIVSKSQRDNDGKLVPVENRIKRIDIELGIEALSKELKIKDELGRPKFPLSNLDLPKLRLTSLNLENADLSNTDLSNANLWETNLSNANLLAVDLFGTDLSKTDLMGVKNLMPPQLVYIVYEIDAKPKNFPGHFILPADRAYKLEVDIYGVLTKHFVPSDRPWSRQPVDEWLEKERKDREERKNNPSPQPPNKA